jgi:endonuclease/exonuclease/phosphatase family metal-dependent hydrolase
MQSEGQSLTAKPGASFRLMTYNIGGGRKDFGSVWDSVITVIREVSPDILFLQEAIEWWDADQNTLSLPQAIGEALEYMQGVYFGPALSMQEQFHPGKAIFVHGVFHDYREWRQGNAVLSRSGFSRMADPGRAGEPWNIPLSAL